MKIVYCCNGTWNSGGMERVLINKANYLADILKYEVCIITTEQKGRPHFFTPSSKINFFDLGINYDDDEGKNLIVRLFIKQLKKIKHKRLLTHILLQEAPDLCVSMFDRDVSFLYKIKDGSRKILEYHFSRYQKVICADNTIIRWAQAIRAASWNFMVQKYDRFVVLTEEDRKAWGNIRNIEVIPNFITELPANSALLSVKRVISVGRLSFQKGFDRLLEAWKIVHSINQDWSLYIFGDGDKKQELQNLLEELKLSNNVFFMPATSNIGKEYQDSSIYVFSSRYEGFGMVLIEAMSYGLPIVSFTCPCGPCDIIDESFGSLVADGDTDSLARELLSWMADEDKRIKAGKNARSAAERYLQSEVMKKWDNLFRCVLS